MKRTGTYRAVAVYALFVLMSLSIIPAAVNASGKVHIVQKGDTLWDLSSFYLYDPFVWPQVWNANRDIENPHLIYPGQEIVIPEKVVRTAVPPVEARPVLPPPEPVMAQPEPAPLPEPASLPEPEPVPEPEPPAEVIKQEMILALSTYGFIIDDEEIGIGTITSAEENRMLVSPGMKVYVETDKGTSLQTDARYSVVRVYNEVRHPATGKRVGYLARVLGDMTVVDAREKLATAIVGDVYRDIKFGDQVMEHIDYLTWLPREGSSGAVGALTGMILANPDGKTIMGESDIVFIDLGSDDGLRTGDRLNLVVQKEIPGAVQPPEEVLGEIQVIVPRARTSVARITRSEKDIGVGATARSSAP
ncbi:MAG: LysM peptidoglycan-binding domain-containing protein [bacterium]|nr:LysM peptidoglycan-binding domain-containing protein [bacterium]MDT8396799.1 LysM peptidoglycan-binding domain-containing protein [bacterium]